MKMKMMMMKVMVTCCNFQNGTSLVFPPSLLRRQSWSRIFWQLLIVVGGGGGGGVARLCIFYFQPIVVGSWEREGCKPLLGLPCREESEGIFFGRGVSQVDLWPSFWIQGITLLSFSLFCVWKIIELFQIWTIIKLSCKTSSLCASLQCVRVKVLCLAQGSSNLVIDY